MIKPIKKRQYFISILAICSVAAICYPFMDWIGYRSVALILLLVVSILALRLSLYPVLVAAILSALVWDFFFIPPQFTLSVSNSEDVLLLLMYFIVALLNGVFNFKLRLMEQIERQKEEKEMSLKLYNTLFDSLSHELRTPIATILGAADTLEVNGDKIPPLSKMDLIHEISKAALRLNFDVENLLNVSRLDSGMIKPNWTWCDVNELIYNVLHKLKTDLDNHKIQVQIPPNMPLVKLDFGLTEQALHNLIKNAVTYTPIQSEIIINVNILATKTGHFSGNVNIVDAISHTLFIDITDRGKGFPENEIAFIFDKFYRLKNTEQRGTGLGLYIVKGFIEAQNGLVSIKNQVNGGAKLTIQIPTPIINQSMKDES